MTEMEWEWLDALYFNCDQSLTNTIVLVLLFECVKVLTHLLYALEDVQ